MSTFDKFVGELVTVCMYFIFGILALLGMTACEIFKVIHPSPKER
jgi:predicted HAD superfamily Cof-like phosphohydrolase